MAAVTETAPISDWLARAHPSPPQARTEWTEHALAMIPLGREFAAIRLAGDLVHAAVGSAEPGHVAITLGDLLDGPVIHDVRTAGATYYALVHVSAGPYWNHSHLAPFLTSTATMDAYLGVPRLDREEPPGSYWVCPPRFDGDLCDVAAVRTLAEVGTAVLDTLRAKAEQGETA